MWQCDSLKNLTVTAKICMSVINVTLSTFCYICGSTTMANSL